MMESDSAALSAARWLVGVIGSVVIGFVVAMAISQYIESAIETRTTDIITNAMPSIQILSSTRGDLRRLEDDVDRYARSARADRSELRARISAERVYIGASLASYAVLPFLPDETPLYRHAAAQLDRLGAKLDRYLASADASDDAKVLRELDAFDQAIEQMITFDAAEGQRLGLQIERIHGRTRASVVLLAAVSIVLAVIGLVLAVRQLRRMTSSYRSKLALHERREAALALQNEALGNFAGRVAHDILSPLTAAALSFELLRQLQMHDPETRRAMDRGSSAITSVHTLVQGLLAFSRAGGQPEPGVSTEIAKVVTDVVDELHGQAQQQDIAVHIAPLPAASVPCSSGVLTSLIANLVRNAIKYMGSATERRIDVRVREADTRWRFEIEDTGPGVAPEQQQRIFEPYVQLARGSSGIGLGLATVDRLVRAHAGSAGVISPARAGRGSLFWFELPRSIAPPTLGAPYRDAAPAPAQHT